MKAALKSIDGGADIFRLGPQHQVDLRRHADPSRRVRPPREPRRIRVIGRLVGVENDDARPLPVTDLVLVAESCSNSGQALGNAQKTDKDLLPLVGHAVSSIRNR